MSALIIAVAIVVALAATYIRWSLRRIRRLQRRVHGAERALIAKLNARSEAVMALNAMPECDYVVRLAKDVSGSPVETEADRERRQYRENDLTRALWDLPPQLPTELLRAVTAANRQASVARQVHTDVVRDAIVAGEKPVAILFGGTRRYSRPEYWDLADPKEYIRPDLALSVSLAAFTVEKSDLGSRNPASGLCVETPVFQWMSGQPEPHSAPRLENYSFLVR